MNIALFYDVNGHLRLLLHMVRNWQIARSSHFDVMLIAGDLGCFPEPSKFDKATKRWVGRDPEEAGFAKYFTSPVAEVEQLFEPEFEEFSAIHKPRFSLLSPRVPVGANSLALRPLTFEEFLAEFEFAGLDQAL